MSRIHLKQNINSKLTNKKAQVKHCSNYKTYIEYSNIMNDIYKNIDGYNHEKI